MTPEPDDAAARAARSERRRVARLHHPDLGGDPDDFVEAMRRLDRPRPPQPLAPPPTAPLRVEVVRTTRGRFARLLRRRARPIVDRLTPRRRYGGY
ncbi:hypothetical protein [Nocardioides litoris]|uniref:hypothetical protein n=1 Tax=Nocardioides litoris TaxID=1926648 RepID=UPI00111FE505|nr:hypothetical protein [Nocardioides litoris]